MGFEKPDTRYWDDKFAAYLHDPFDKVFQIKGHGERAADLLEIFGLQKPNEEFWKRADSIAAGFERGQVPSYSSDPQKNGAVDFQERPVLTHPTSGKARLEMDFRDMTDWNIEKIHGELTAFLKENIGIKPGAGGYSDEFKGDDKRFAIARFLYTHLVLRFRLAHKNVGGIGALWHRLPADSRFPDHSVWQHNSLVSALYSCMSLAGDETQVGMMVFSITPVQGFIAMARKLRDYWTGSILLSWLAFEGMRWIIENLGPDHILYPSLVDQPLINAYLAREWKTGPVSSDNTVKGIASFPNKFLFLLPLNQTKAIGAAITDHIRDAWSLVWREVEEKIISGANDKNGHIKEMFERQNENFWDMQWAAVKLLDRDDRAEFAELLPLNKFNKQWDILEIFNELIKDKPFYESSGRGILYSVSHSLVQAALAAQKAQKKITRPPEPGEKCHLCGELEVLHAKKHNEGAPVTEYKVDIDQFWDRLKQGWDAEFDFEANERLCSICLVKRIAYKILGEKNHHILSENFRGMEFYPSTTQIALYNRFKREKITDKKEQHRIAQEYHAKPDEQAENRDSYYAILLMDGDHMGKLVNGETLASTWESAMHPDIVKRLKGPGFSKKYKKAWETIFADYSQRLLTPSIHTAISEALGDFSIYGVAEIIKQNEGKLIYAGGDDVCAVLPVDTVLDAAREIKDYYNSAFKLITDNGSDDVSSGWRPESGKLSVCLGDEEQNRISISAGILICHHKENLTMMIKEAHDLLDQKAKNETGRNACAIELRKRAGGSRFFVRKWNDPAWKAFNEIGELITDKNKQKISKSLVYRLERFRSGIEAILERGNYFDLMAKFISKQLDRSILAKPGESDERRLEEFAKKMVEIVVAKDGEQKPVYQPEGLVVAAFIADKGDK